MNSYASIHGAVYLKITPGDPIFNPANGKFFHTIQVYARDAQGSTHTLTVYSNAPVDIDFPEPKKEPMDVMEALNDLCTIR